MNFRVEELKEKQVVCVKNGCVLGNVSDIEIDSETGKMSSLIIFGKSKLLGLFGRENDIVIPFEEIEIIGSETILVKCDVGLLNI